MRFLLQGFAAFILVTSVAVTGVRVFASAPAPNGFLSEAAKVFQDDTGTGIVALSLFLLLAFLASARWFAPAGVTTSVLVIGQLPALISDGWSNTGGGVVIAGSVATLTFVALAVPTAAENAYAIHPDFNLLSLFRVSVKSRWVIRIFGAVSRAGYQAKAIPNAIEMTPGECEGYGGRSVPLEFFRARDREASRLPCLVYFHGGGFILPASSHHRELMYRYCVEARCTVVFVDYALAPGAPFPAGVEDCYAALCAVVDDAAALHIDPTRIAVGGDSAGGALGAAVTQMARDRDGPSLRFQMLIYPITDDRMQTESARTLLAGPVWNTRNSMAARTHYIGKTPGPTSPYAYPMRAETLADLPRAYVETAEFDSLRDEGKAYANRLRDDGVDTELVETKGTVHGFEIIKGSEITQNVVRHRVAALERALYSDGGTGQS